MFSRTSRPFISYANAWLSHTVRHTPRRDHSVISTHSSFPATLLRLNAGLTFKPFRFEQQAQGNQSSIGEQPEVSKGLYGNADDWTNYIPLNRATLMPNTFTMQEILRTAADNYLDDKENGLSVESPYVFTIPKGTMLPATLVLLRENQSEFLLQPTRPFAPSDLNNILHEFYSIHADKQDIMKWLDDHEFEDAIAGEKEEEWMAR